MERIVAFSLATKQHRILFRIVTYVFAVSLVVLIAFISLRKTDQNLTRFANEVQLRTAGIIGDQVDIHFDRALAVAGVRIARPEVRAMVAAGDWQGAMATLGPDANHLSFVDRFFLADVDGTVQADYPALGTVGRDFSSQDWYRGVMETGKPYISGVYTRTAEPRYNVIAVSAPIRGDDDTLLGILVVQIHLDTIFSWIRNTVLGTSNAVYIIDASGNLIIHPTQQNLGELTSVVEHPAVQRALNGESGTWTGTGILGREDTVTSYLRTDKGFAIIVEGDRAVVFATRDAEIDRGILLAVIFFLIFILIAWIIQGVISLLANEKRTAEIYLESIGDGVVIIDRAWNIVLANPAAESLSGWDRGEIIGRPLREAIKFVKGPDRREEIRFMEEAMLFGETKTMANDTKLIRKDGTEIDIGDSAAPIKDEHGNVTGLVVVFRDVSQKKDLERTRDEFQSLAAHELRTPITISKQYAELLLEPTYGPLTDKQREMVMAVRKASMRMNDLVNALLNVSRLEEGVVPVNPEPTFIPDVVDKSVKKWSSEAQEQGVSLATEYAENLPTVNADPGVVELVLDNLISNAVKYTPESGRVTVRVEADDSDLIVNVSDTGLGIPQSEQKNVFEKFFRASNVTGDGVTGTGLGLFTAKKVLEHAGCRITFSSQEGAGTTFSVFVPLKGMTNREGTKGLIA